MNITRYKEVYDLEPNYIGVNLSGGFLFVFELFSKPMKGKYNVGVWHIKRKL